jgi:cell volume regulation protein A
MILFPFRCRFEQQLLVSVSGLRGAASIVFAVMATVSPAYTSNDVFHIVFCIVLFSILFQGSLLPFAAKKLGMIDEHTNVLKTFNDYTEEMPVQFIQSTLNETHPWAGKKVRNILLPPETLLVLLQRDGKQTTPNGDTLLLPGDNLVLSAKAPGIIDGISLTELCLRSGDEWIGKRIGDPSGSRQIDRYDPEKGKDHYPRRKNRSERKRCAGHQPFLTV